MSFTLAKFRHPPPISSKTPRLPREVAAMLVSDIITDASTRCNDVQQQIAQNANWIGWINRAQEDLGEFANMEALKSYTSAASTQTYALPDDCIKPRQLKWLLGGFNLIVTYAERDEFDALQVVPSGTTVAPPFPDRCWWNVWAGSIYLWPIPSIAGVANDLTLYYYQQPAAVALTTDTPGIPARFHEGIVLFTCVRLYMAAENLSKAQFYQSEYEEWKAQLTRQLARSQRASAPRVRLRNGR